MTNQTIKIHNVETNEITERDMTDSEFNIWQANQVAVVAERNEAEAKATAKAALLAQLGITAEQAKLLLS